MKTVLLVDDHESMCDSLTHAFRQSGRYTVLASLHNADQAETFCAKVAPDLTVMDVCTEGGASGLDATVRLRERFPAMKIIVMSGFDEITYAPRAGAAGADAFIFKSKSLEYFVRVADLVMQGEKVFPAPRTISLPNGESPFTAREMEVLRLMCRHLTSREIAEELFISVNTVKFHKANMLAKSGFTKAVDLAFYMISNGWINPLY